MDDFEIVKVASPIIKKGFLIKQGGFVPTWKRRWFILKKTSLSYFEDEMSSEPLGTILLANYMLEDTVVPPKEFCFNFRPKQRGERIYPMCADNATEFKEWIQALKVYVF